MNQDEAQRIAEQIRKTVPSTVARVLRVEFNLISGKWEVKCDEFKSPQGGRGITLWIKMPKDWVRLQQWWLQLVKKEQKS